jgi:hypothetical protein
MIYRGLDLSHPDVTSAEELEAFRAFADQPGGQPLASYALWAELRPDVLKRTLLFSREVHVSDKFKCSLPFLNVYAVGGWIEGVRYQLGLLQGGTFVSESGYSREAVIETLALSNYLAPSWGPVVVADCVRECLTDYRDPDPDAPSPFPEGWKVAPEELRAGLDYSTRELSQADLRALTDWYMRVCGEVPPSVRLTARYRPTLLKADRGRWENIVRSGLPNEMFAYLLIHYEVWRGNPAGARDALLLGRGLGLTKEYAVDAIWYASFFGSTGTIAASAEVLEEVLDSW